MNLSTCINASTWKENFERRKVTGSTLALPTSWTDTIAILMHGIAKNSIGRILTGINSEHRHTSAFSTDVETDVEEEQILAILAKNLQKLNLSNFKKSGKNTGQSGTSTEQSGKGQSGTGRSGTEQPGKGQSGTGQSGTAQSGTDTEEQKKKKKKKYTAEQQLEYWTKRVAKQKSEEKSDDEQDVLLTETTYSTDTTFIDVSIQATDIDRNRNVLRIDTQSSVHIIMNPELSEPGSIRSAQSMGFPGIKVTGICQGHPAVPITQICTIKGTNLIAYFKADDIAANILSFGRLSRNNEIKISADGITVDTEKRTLFFKLNDDDKYSMNMEHNNSVLDTTIERMQPVLSKRKLLTAKKVLKLRNTLQISDGALKRMINANYKGMEELCGEDVDNCRDLFGPEVSVVQGTATNSQRKVEVTTPHPTTRGSVIVALDIIHMDSLSYLFGLTNPGRLVTTNKLDHQDHISVRDAIRTTISTIEARGFKVTDADIDNGGNLTANIPWLEETARKIITNTTGTNNHNPSLNAYVRLVKEKYRSIVAATPFKIPSEWLPHVMRSAVMLQNLIPTDNGMSPRQWFTNSKVDMRSFTQARCMQYVQAVVGDTKNDSSPRTIPAIVAYPIGNLAGTFKLISLETFKLVNSGNMIPCPTTPLVIDKIANMSSKRLGIAVEVDDKVDRVDENSKTDDGSIEKVDANENQKVDDNADSVENQKVDGNADSVENQKVDAGENNQAKKVDVGDNIDTLALAIESHMLATDVFATDVMNWSNFSKEAAIALSRHMEIKQMIDRNVLIPDPKIDGRIIPAQMLDRLKLKPDGSVDKMKSRLVAGGHRQIKAEVSGGVEAYTPHTPHIMALITASHAQNLKHKVVDITGAFLNAEMTDRVFLRLNKGLTKEFIALKPEWKVHVKNDGTMILRIAKAMYGTLEAAKLWQQLVTKVLVDKGYKPNQYDPCIFYKRNSNGTTTTAICYVDDFYIINDVRDELEGILRKAFTDITVKRGTNLDYLGMNVDLQRDGKVVISMKGYIDKMLKEYEQFSVVKNYSTPARDELMTDDPNSPKLNEEEAGYFHTHVARALFLAKRMRPDILFAISMLCRKVMSPSQKDKKCLDRVMGYINETRHIPLTLEAGNGVMTSDKPMKVLNYVDAAYGLHQDDFKGQTGQGMSLGKGIFSAKSNKQSIMCKSSTGTELIALSDGVGPPVGTSNMMSAQGYNMEPPVIYEDNKSAMKMAENGRPTTDKSRHMHIRYFFMSDLLKRGELKIEYIKTKDQIADILTKPLPRHLFCPLRDLMLNVQTVGRSLKGCAGKSGIDRTDLGKLRPSV